MNTGLITNSTNLEHARAFTPFIREKRPWKVIADPSGDFLGRSFRPTDLQFSDFAYWPTGIVFQNTTTRDYKVWREMRFITVKFVCLNMKGFQDEL